MRVTSWSDFSAEGEWADTVDIWLAYSIPMSITQQSMLFRVLVNIQCRTRI